MLSPNNLYPMREGPFGTTQVQGSPIKNSGILEESSKDDVVITGAKGSTYQPPSCQGAGTCASGYAPQDGSGCFMKGLTLQPLSQLFMKLARERGTSSIANSFGFHMSQVFDVFVISFLLSLFSCVRTSAHSCL